MSQKTYVQELNSLFSISDMTSNKSLFLEEHREENVMDGLKALIVNWATPSSLFHNVLVVFDHLVIGL